MAWNIAADDLFGFADRDRPNILRLVFADPDFRRFEQPSMENYARGIGAVFDPQGAQLDFMHKMLTVDEYRHLKMAVYFQQP